jgi:hypothetical protein
MQRDDEVTTDDLASAADRPAQEEGTDERVIEVEGEASTGAATAEEHRPLLPAEDTESFRKKWERIQAGFVDEPRHSVEEADKLVAQIMKRLAASFAAERESLEGQWDRGDEVGTDDLRIALQRYRSFFDRLLAM